MRLLSFSSRLLRLTAAAGAFCLVAVIGVPMSVAHADQNLVGQPAASSTDGSSGFSLSPVKGSPTSGVSPNIVPIGSGLCWAHNPVPSPRMSGGNLQVFTTGTVTCSGIPGVTYELQIEQSLGNNTWVSVAQAYVAVPANGSEILTTLYTCQGEYGNTYRSEGWFWYQGNLVGWENPSGADYIYCN